MRKKLPYFLNMQSGFSGSFFNYRYGRFSYICLVILYVFFFRSICSTLFTFIQVQIKKTKTKELSKRLSTKVTKNYAESACNIQCRSTLSRENSLVKNLKVFPTTFYAFYQAWIYLLSPVILFGRNDVALDKVNLSPDITQSFFLFEKD